MILCGRFGTATGADSKVHMVENLCRLTPKYTTEYDSTDLVLRSKSAVQRAEMQVLGMS